MKSGGTIVSFEIKKKKKQTLKQAAFKFINKLKIIDISNNLGDTKSFITHPYTTTHHRLDKSEKKSLRITENLIRLSVGLEDIDDLIEDINNSLT